MLTYIAYANSFLYIKDWYITSCDIFVFCRRQEILELSDSILKTLKMQRVRISVFQAFAYYVIFSRTKDMRTQIEYSQEM